MKEDTGFVAVFIREVKRLTSSKVYIWGAWIANIIALALLMYLMNAGLPSKMPIAVVDLDNTATTRSLIQKLDASQKTDVKFNVGSFSEATDLMNRREVYAILLIPRNFTTETAAGKQPRISYYTNMAYKIPSSLLLQDLITIGVLASASVEQKIAMKEGLSATEIQAVVSPIRQEVHPLHNPYLNYSILLNGMILAGFLQLTTMLFTVSSLGTEMKNGTATELIRLSGGSTWKMMFGKLLPNTIFMTIIALLEISVLNYYNGFPMYGGFWSIFIAYVLLIMAAQSFAIILFAVFSNYRMTISAASLLGMLSFSLIGFSYPTTQMNPILNSFSHIYPVKIFYLIYGSRSLNGYPLHYSYWSYLQLMGYIFIALILFRRVRKILQFDKYEP